MQEGEEHGKAVNVEDLEGSNKGLDWPKHLVQGRHWIHNRLLPVSMVRRCATAGSPNEKLAINCVELSSAKTSARVSSVAAM